MGQKCTDCSIHNLLCLLCVYIYIYVICRCEMQIIVELLLSPSPIFSFCFRFSSYSFHSFHSIHSFPRVDPLLLSGSLALTTQAVQLLPLRGFDGHLLARWADRMDRGWRWQCVPTFLMQSSLLNERLNSHSAWTEMGKYNLCIYIYRDWTWLKRTALYAACWHL